jgi:hypothetical protein
MMDTGLFQGRHRMFAAPPVPASRVDFALEKIVAPSRVLTSPEFLRLISLQPDVFKAGPSWRPVYELA